MDSQHGKTGPDDLSIPASPANERRLSLRVLDFWRRLAPEEGIPSLADIDPAAFAGVWPYCALFEIRDDPAAPLLVECGSALAVAFGDPPAIGQPLSTLAANCFPGLCLSYTADVLERCTPISRGGEATDRSGARKLYRSILLPLAADGETVDGFLGAVSFRDVAGD